MLRTASLADFFRPFDVGEGVGVTVVEDETGQLLGAHSGLEVYVKGSCQKIDGAGC